MDPVAFIRSQTEIKSPSIVPEIVLHLVTEVMPLWQFTEDRLQQSDLPPPFWAIAWPGGQGIARYILDHPESVKGRRVIDFAAGSGIAAIAAMKSGAKSAMAIDIDPLALEAIQLNAMNNKVDVQITDHMDLTKPYTKADIIFAGDICYQQSMSATLIRWLRLCVEADIDVLMADPGRAYVPEEGLAPVISYEVPTSRDIEDKDIRTVNVWKMEKIGELY
jgi:predicted nicotinamide N-methyase